METTIIQNISLKDFLSSFKAEQKYITTYLVAKTTDHNKGTTNKLKTFIVTSGTETNGNTCVPSTLGTHGQEEADTIVLYHALAIGKHAEVFIACQSVADREISGPWGPQFCGPSAMVRSNVYQLRGRWKRPPGGMQGRAPKANAFWQQYILKIGWKLDIFVAFYTHNSDPISDVVAYGKSRYPSRLYEICHLSGNHSHIIITCSRQRLTDN